MPSCEMCGANAPLFVAIVEGARLKVCQKCSGAGKVLDEVRPQLSPKKAAKAIAQAKAVPKTVHIIVGDYAKRIQVARARSGLSQKEFAARLNERESYVQHLENGKAPPSVEVARKLERILNIRLFEEIEESPGAEEEAVPKRKDEALTLGDVIQYRKR